MTSMTSDEILSVIKTRQIQLIFSQGRWIARTKDGSRLSPGNVSFNSPEEAVEAANSSLLSMENRESEIKATRIVNSLESGKYFIRPKTVQSTDQDGNPTTQKLFSVFLPNGTATPVVDRLTLTQAVIDMENLSNELNLGRNSR